MDLKEIASVSGKGGLFKVIKPTRTGVILETIDKDGKRIIANANSRVSILKEISIYTTSAEGSIPLQTVLEGVHSKYKGEIELNSKSSDAELWEFLGDLVPDYDEERVYPSDVKKLISWYKILHEHAPDTLVAEKETKEKKKESPKAEKSDSDSEKKPAKEKKASKA